MHLTPPTVLFASLMYVAPMKVVIKYFSMYENHSWYSSTSWKELKLDSLGRLEMKKNTIRYDPGFRKDFVQIRKFDLLIVNCAVLYNQFKCLTRKIETLKILTFFDCFQIEPEKDNAMLYVGPHVLQHYLSKVGDIDNVLVSIWRSEKLEFPSLFTGYLSLVYGY